MASASVHPLETVFSASALIRALTRLSSVVCLTVLMFPRRKPISADRRVTAKKSTAWPIPGRGGGVASSARPVETEALAGLVERVTFHNPDNGFCVLRVKARGQRDLITVVGHAAMITAGEFVQMSGAWVNDRTHGQQFRASFLKATPPTTLEGIERYLASGLIRGIGPVS